MALFATSVLSLGTYTIWALFDPFFDHFFATFDPLLRSLLTQSDHANEANRPNPDSGGVKKGVQKEVKKHRKNDQKVPISPKPDLSKDLTLFGGITFLHFFALFALFWVSILGNSRTHFWAKRGPKTDP